MIYVLGGGGGAGATLTVTAPASAAISITNGTKTKSSTVSSSGTAVFKGLETGEWTITITSGSSTATKTVSIDTDYTTTIAFFSATIAVTYPSGSTCTCTGQTSGTVLTASDTSGSYTFSVSTAEIWRVYCSDGDNSTYTDVNISTDGQSETITLAYELVLFNNGVNNVNYTSVSNGAIRGSGPSYYSYGATTITHTTAVDFSAYSTLYITATTAKYVTVQVLDSSKTQISTTTISTGTTSIDISSVSVTGYVQFSITTGYTEDVGSLVATKVWLG